MKRMAAITMFGLGALNAQAYIFGVRLVSVTEHPMVMGSGSNYANVGVTDGGLGSSEYYSASGSGYFQTGATSSASDSVDLKVNVFWLQTSDADAPPSSLYLNRAIAGSCFATSSLTAMGPGGQPGTGGTVTASCKAAAGTINTAANASGKTSTDNHSSMGYWTSSTQVSVQWVLYATLGGDRFYVTQTPIGFSTPGTSAYGTCHLSGGPNASASASGISTGGLGVSHHFATTPIPIINGGSPPTGGGATGGAGSASSSAAASKKP